MIEGLHVLRLFAVHFLFWTGVIASIPLIYLPLVLLPCSLHQRQLLTQRVNHHLYGGLLILLQVSGMFRFQISGRENLINCSSTLIIANHPTLIDVVVMLALMPKVTCIAKAELGQHPLFALPIRLSGYIFNQDAHGLIEQSRSILDRGEPLLIFPEGTRTTPGQPPSFQKGAAAIALQTGANLILVYFQTSHSALFKNSRWYKFPRRGVTMSLNISSPLSLDKIRQKIAKTTLTARDLTRYLEQIYHDCR